MKSYVLFDKTRDRCFTIHVRTFLDIVTYDRLFWIVNVLQTRCNKMWSVKFWKVYKTSLSWRKPIIWIKIYMYIYMVVWQKKPNFVLWYIGTCLSIVLKIWNYIPLLHREYLHLLKKCSKWILTNLPFLIKSRLIPSFSTRLLIKSLLFSEHSWIKEKFEITQGIIILL